MRGVGTLLAGLAPGKAALRETTSFTTLGIMLDCSRNAVMKVDHLKVWLRRLALLGYNQVMLYTEDTYELPRRAQLRVPAWSLHGGGTESHRLLRGATLASR